MCQRKQSFLIVRRHPDFRFPAQASASCNLRRNKMSLHLFGTSRLHEELKLYPVTAKTRSQHQRQSNCSPNRLSYYPVHYKFWAPVDDTLSKCFNNNRDRRILAASRRSQCMVQLLSPVRKNANGISVQQISIQAPSLGALERCCSILDDVFPQFNASITLRGRGTESKAVEEEETEAEVSTVAVLESDEDINDIVRKKPENVTRCTRTPSTPITALLRRCPKSTRAHNQIGLISFIISQMKKNEQRVIAEVYPHPGSLTFPSDAEACDVQK